MQLQGYHGISVRLLPANNYSLVFQFDLSTWDSYNYAAGYWDSFSFSVTSKPYPDLPHTDPLTYPFVWGGEYYGDGKLDNKYGTETITFLGDIIEN